ncbi:phospholipase D-like domain-containing protein [Gracilimonas sp.]|uniref:phospholipase D-like domain-containing protein n=1 Tax=Gracilimonas sp. TaxID=1974203 RepID=UPI003D0FED36
MCINYAASEIRVFMDSDHFFEQLTADVQNARHSVSIQCMSFEADQVGTKLIELLGSKPTLERTLLIDDYSRFVVNDTFLNAPHGWLNKNNARKERQALDGLLEQARQSGIRVKLTNPMGFLMHRYPARNHKKMVLVDEEISYLGGMNFTEHNFEWSDAMVRHTNPDIVAALKTSFQADLNETTPPPITEINPETVLYLLNGWKTKEAYTNLLERVTSSRKVVALSPYISYPMLDAIASVPDNQVILPKANNKPLMHYIHNLKRYSEINFKYVSGKMVHAKMLILDDEVAVYGSSNFDVISYFFEKEVVMVNKNPELIKQLTSFTSQLINK